MSWFVLETSRPQLRLLNPCRGVKVGKNLDGNAQKKITDNLQSPNTLPTMKFEEAEVWKNPGDMETRIQTVSD